MTYANLQALLKVHCPESDVTLDNGMTMRVKGLTRADMHDMMGMKSARGKDMFALEKGVVNPTLSRDDVEALCAVLPAGYLTPATDEILRLSGVGSDNAVKDADADFRDES